MGRLFGTDGVRGIANEELTPELAFKIGQATAALLLPSRGKGKIVIGRDTRLSGDLLEAALVAGICSSGEDVLKAGVIPTPAVAYLTRELEADAGVVISASHNPSEYNGIKFFASNGFKLPDALEDEIEKLVKKESWKGKRPTGAKIGKVFVIDDAVERYVNYAVNTIEGDLDGFTIALDCANGAAYLTSPAILRKLGVKVLTFATNPDGLNINHECGSTYPQFVQEIVKSHEVDLGFAHDGDADRIIAVDENGEEVDGDFIMAICALHLKGKKVLPKNSVVTTVMTNLGFYLAMKEHEINVVETKVGDRYVLEEMLAKGISLGGEQSGHIIFLDHSTTGDGIVTILQIMATLRDTGKKLSDLKKVMKRLPQVLINVKVKDKTALKTARKVWETVDSAEKLLKDKGRILVRPSGTEPLVRVMVEAETEERANSIAREIADVVEKELG